MSRQQQRRSASYGGGAGGDGWEDRWRDRTDDDIADLQHDYIEAVNTIREIREWIRNHDQRHSDERQDRQRAPDDVRQWLALAISILAALVALGVIKPGG